MQWRATFLVMLLKLENVNITPAPGWVDATQEVEESNPPIRTHRTQFEISWKKMVGLLLHLLKNN